MKMGTKIHQIDLNFNANIFRFVLVYIIYISRSYIGELSLIPLIDISVNTLN